MKASTRQRRLRKHLTAHTPPPIPIPDLDPQPTNLISPILLSILQKGLAR